MQDLSPQDLVHGARVTAVAALGAGVLLALGHAAAMRRFSRLLDRLPQEPGPEERAAFLRRIRWTGLGASLLHGVIFFLLICATWALLPWAWKCVPIIWYGGAVLFQADRQFQVEKRLRHTQASNRENLLFTARVLGASVLVPACVGSSIYLVMSSLKFLPASALAAHPAWGAALHVLGPAALGALVVAAMLLLSPKMMRLMLPSEPVTDPVMLEIVERCFARAGLKSPEPWLLKLERFGAHTAMIVGLRTRIQWAQPAVFFTRSLFERLEPAECEAVLLHEVSHVALRHVPKRAAFSLLISVSLAAPAYLLTLFLASRLGINPLNFLFIYIPWMILQLVGIRWVVRYQEMEADSHAVIAFGADAGALDRGLRKLMSLNDLQTDQNDPTSLVAANAGHPAVDERARELERRLERRRAGLPPVERWLPITDLFRGRVKYVSLALSGLFCFLLQRYVSVLRPRHELTQAAERGDPARVRGLVARGVGVDGIDALDEWNRTPLTAAVGDAGMTRWLLEQGADPNLSDGQPGTPIFSAVRKQNLDSVKALLARGADPNRKSSRFWSPLFEAAWDGNPDIVRTLLRAGAKPAESDRFGQTPLFTAAMKNRSDIVSQMILAGAPFDKPDRYGWTPLMWAVKKGGLETAALLLERGASASHAASDGKTPLMLAVESPKADAAVALLLAHRAAPGARDVRYRTALDAAVAKGDPALVAVLKNAVATKTP
jgi:ankyrin repeat protein/Zn-dependent protease with chaperone function